MVLDPASIDVLILCGGFGQRLREVVSDRPKPMAEVSGRPFLDYLVEWTAAQGFRRFVLCAGYQGEMIAQHYARTSLPVEIETCIESTPLGTGGAVQNAAPKIRSDPVLVANGDSFCEVDLVAFLRFFEERNAAAAMVLARAPGERFGRVEVDPTGEILGFQEKQPGDGWINAGIYLLSRKILQKIPQEIPISLERDLFPSLVKDRFYGMESSGVFVDMGTPEGYRQAQRLTPVRRR